jgi:hypothetical protein
MSMHRDRCIAAAGSRSAPLPRQVMVLLAEMMRHETITEILLTICLSLVTIAVASADTEADVKTIRAVSKPTHQLHAEKQPIFQALAHLAEGQQMDASVFLRYRFPSGHASFSSAYCVPIVVGQQEHLVVVQTVEPWTIPGTSAQQLVLLSADGRILDRVQCHINSRYGRVVALFPKDEPDGADAVLSFRGKYWHNWHTIIHKRMSETFRDEETDRANEWDQRGLCRLVIADDQFQIIFPVMEENKKRESQPVHAP